MNKITRKLRSRTGASMILAMVFMLFCLFVGGTVLASAAANGYRVEHLSDQQQYLDERSAALLISDELAPAGSPTLKLTIHEITKTIQPVDVDEGGVVVNSGSASVSYSVVIHAPANLKMTAMQRIAAECTVWQYLKEKGITDTGIVQIKGFVYDKGTPTVTSDDVTIGSLADFWYQYDLSGTADISGKIDITGTTGTDTFTDFDAYFSSATETDLYDFVVDFGDYTQMNVVMNAYAGTRDPVTSSQVTTYGGGYARITTESRQIAISWDDPLIEKGGA